MNQEAYALEYNLGTLDDFKTKFGEPIGGDPIWVSYVNGQANKQREIDAKNYKDYKLDEFEAELKVLCKKYDVKINFGCGCCGAGARCKDLEFSFEIK